MSNIDSAQNNHDTNNENSITLETEVMAAEVALTPDEKARFEELRETVIEGGTQAAKASHALKEIKEKRLYREKHNTWDEFCTEVFDITVQRAGQLIAAAEIEQQLRDDGVNPTHIPKSERALRELGRTKPDMRIKVFQHALESAEGAPLTSAIIAKSREELMPRKSPDEKPKQKPIEPSKVSAQMREMLEQVNLGEASLAEISDLIKISRDLTSRLQIATKGLGLNLGETMVSAA